MLIIFLNIIYNERGLIIMRVLVAGGGLLGVAFALYAEVGRTA